MNSEKNSQKRVRKILIIMLIIFIPILNTHIIKHEEQILEERFDEEYRELKGRFDVGYDISHKSLWRHIN